MTRYAAVMIVHGPLEDQDTVDRIESIRAAIDPYWHRSIGEDDRVTFLVDAAATSLVVAAVLDRIPERRHGYQWPVRVVPPSPF